MASKSCPKTNMSWVSTAQLGYHSEPIYAEEDLKSNGRKKMSKTERDEVKESVDSGKKKRRMSAISAPGETEDCQSLPKRSRRTPGPAETEGQRQKPSPCESPKHQAPIEALTSHTASPHSKAAFKAKYEVGHVLGKGGFGTVFAGHRRHDNLPVAIKSITKRIERRTQIELDGKICMVPKEVALLLKLQPQEGETSAVVALLDWYYLDEELILVLERPEPCMDGINYIKSKKPTESEVKTVIKQLVDALIEIHSKGVFHNDIKPDNILTETGSAVPRVRLIDFGCGTFLSKEKYNTPQGTSAYTSPEWFSCRSYKAESATVWQLGVTVFGFLHKHLPFRNHKEILYKHPQFNVNLSYFCQDFLLRCLTKCPDNRSTLARLKRHHWLM